MKKAIIYIVSSISLCTALPLSGQTISNSVISAGGGKSDNAIYSSFAVVGESFTGFDSRSSYKLFSGLLNSIEISTGINNELVGSKVIRLYPNPAKDNIHIEADGIDVLEVEICSVSGVILKRLKIRGQCDLSFLPKGTYLIKVYNTRGAYLGIRRVIKL